MAADPKDLKYFLYYRSEKNVELSLIVSLYTRMYLGKDKQTILESLVKSFGREFAA